MRTTLFLKSMIKVILVFVAINMATTASAQPFINEIKAFRKADSINKPPKNAVLLIGSSSFTKWKDVQDYFPEYTILNRGFGGSSLTDVIFYANDVVLKYKPKQILIYCGENDLAANDTITPQIVLNRFKQLFTIIRTQLNKKTPILFVAIKPSIARWHLERKYIETNQLIKDFLSTKKYTQFLDVHNAMLDENGKVFQDIFVKDNLHMNAKGYAIWQKIIAPYLLP